MPNKLVSNGNSSKRKDALFEGYTPPCCVVSNLPPGSKPNISSEPPHKVLIEWMDYEELLVNVNKSG